MPSTLSPDIPTLLPDGIVVIELRTGLWMVKEQPKGAAVGVIRGYLSEAPSADGTRFLARLPHFNPAEGPLLGEYREWALAVQRVLSSSASPAGSRNTRRSR